MMRPLVSDLHSRPRPADPIASRSSEGSSKRRGPKTDPAAASMWQLRLRVWRPAAPTASRLSRCCSSTSRRSRPRTTSSRRAAAHQQWLDRPRGGPSGSPASAH